MKQLVVYIAGPISDPDFTVAVRNLATFYHMESTLIRRGYAPINPAADLIASIIAGDFQRQHYTRKGEALVKHSDAVLLLPGWIDSDGAMQEVSWAKEAGVPVFLSVSKLDEYAASEALLSSRR